MRILIRMIILIIHVEFIIKTVIKSHTKKCLKLSIESCTDFLLNSLHK